MATVWLEQQTTSSSGLKRKCIDDDDDDDINISNKRKVINKKRTKNTSDDDNDERLALSPRISPIITKSTNTNYRSLSSMMLFKCQLCQGFLKNKDHYMNHMSICAIQRQASIKIVRSTTDKNDLTIL